MALASVIGKIVARGAVKAGKSALTNIFGGGTTKAVSGTATVAKAIKFPILGKSKISDETIPPLKNSKNTSKKIKSPKLSDIGTQIESLLKVVKKIESSLSTQQSDLIDQIRNSHRRDEENAMESAYKQSPLLSLSPQANVFSALLEKIRGLSTSINQSKAESSEDKQGLLGLLKGKWGALFGKGAKASVLKAGFSEVNLGSRIAYRSLTTGRFVSASEALGSRSSMIARTMSKIPGASFIGKKIAKGITSSKALTAAATIPLIKKLAKPIIEKAIGKTVLKSIPIIGAIAGIGFAAKRLIEGDVVGAGLDAVSGLGGPLTAIPALIASVSRDIYSSVFGVQPENDPAAGSRLAMVKDSVKQIVMGVIRPAIKPKQSIASSASMQSQQPKVEFKKTVSNKKPEQKTNQTFTTPTLTPPAKSSQQSVTRSSTGPASPVDKDTTSAPPSPIGASSVVTSIKHPKKTDDPVKDMPITSFKTAASNSGKGLSQTSMTVEMASYAPNPPVSLQSATLSNNMSQTSIDGFTGIGNVPDPTYYNDDAIMPQIYFGVAA